MDVFDRESSGVYFLLLYLFDWFLFEVLFLRGVIFFEIKYVGLFMIKDMLGIYEIVVMNVMIELMIFILEIF